MPTYIDIDRLRTIWKGIKARCSNPANAAFQSYGGRGITVCAEWQSFQRFAGWSIVNGYADTLEIDRIDNDGPYCPGNCRWVTPKLNRSRRLITGRPEASGKLDRVSIDRLLANDSTGRHWDGKGLYLHVSAKGTASWRWKYRFDGRERLLTFGRWPQLGITEAREMRAIAATHLGRGKDPAKLRS